MTVNIVFSKSYIKVSQTVLKRCFIALHGVGFNASLLWHKENCSKLTQNAATMVSKPIQREALTVQTFGRNLPSLLQ